MSACALQAMDEAELQAVAEQAWTAGEHVATMLLMQQHSSGGDRQRDPNHRGIWKAGTCLGQGLGSSVSAAAMDYRLSRPSFGLQVFIKKLGSLKRAFKWFDTRNTRKIPQVAPV